MSEQKPESGQMAHALGLGQPEMFHQMMATSVTQVGSVFETRMLLPLKIDGQVYALRVQGVGPDHIKAELIECTHWAAARQEQ